MLCHINISMCIAIKQSKPLLGISSNTPTKGTLFIVYLYHVSPTCLVYLTLSTGRIYVFVGPAHRGAVVWRSWSVG